MAVREWRGDSKEKRGARREKRGEERRDPSKLSGGSIQRLQFLPPSPLELKKREPSWERKSRIKRSGIREKQ